MSISKVKSATTIGLEAFPVEIEADLSNGLPSLIIVGLPDKAVDESKERVRSAIKNSGINFPQKRITINLAPADVKKEGPVFDLAIAAAIIKSSEQIKCDTSDSIFIGELSLDGSLRRINGVLPIVHFAKTIGMKKIYLPKDNLTEAEVITDIEIYPLNNISELYHHLKEEKIIAPVFGKEVNSEELYDLDFDISHVKGQDHAKRALEIAAAGAHNILLFGPPGSGKTMLARTLSGILPALDFEEMIEVSKIYSVSGLLDKESPIMTKRPFRNPHHTSSDIALVGGGRWPRPGEITLAHRGVLFLDELPEFSRNVLEVLRQPLEDNVVNVARATQSITFPANFLLIASQNPCPCGYLGDDKKNCVCSPSQIARYKKKISGPLLDRIDIHLEVPRVEIEKLSTVSHGEKSCDVRKRVQNARKIQKERFEGTKIKTNAEMNQKALTELANVSEEAMTLLKSAAENLSLSARSYFRTIKLARTIADLENSNNVKEPHMAEALQYRKRDSD